MENNTFYRLGLNIRNLRKLYGLTQEDLALAIDVTKQAISKYELGSSIPERDILLNLSHYFRVTENELLNGDFEGIGTIANVPILERDYTVGIFEKFFPLICTSSALKNPSFEKAYTIHQRLYYSIIEDDEYDENAIAECMHLYDSALESGVVEAAANSLWGLMLIGYFKSICSPQMIENAILLQDNRINVKDFFAKSILRPTDMDTKSEEYRIFEKEHQLFWYENRTSIFLKIKKLKQSKKYANLGDYYLAFIYLFNIICNTNSQEMNTAIGTEMMTTYSFLGNPYARKFLRINN